MNKYLITIVGPTAIGKTSLSLKIANHFDTDILSADSRQIYKEMQIGTAVPTQDELEIVKHHFIQSISINQEYDVWSFEKDALARLNKLYRNNDFVVMVGGSGLYIDAVIKGLDNFPPIDSTIRESLTEKMAVEGLEVLQMQLRELDPITFQKIDIQNPHRVIRALEVCLFTGKPFSSYLEQPKELRQFKTIMIGLTAERRTLYERINKRVDQMIDDGLLEEAASLYENKQLNVLNTVGYKELFKYFQDEWTLAEAIAEIKKNTRRFAKRQITWFKKKDSITWYDFRTPHTIIIADIDRKILDNEIK